MIKRIFCILLLGIAFSQNLKCIEETNYKFLLERMFVIPKWIENQPTISINYGYCIPSIPIKNFLTKFSVSYPIELSYGFTRYEYSEDLGLENILYYASGFAHIANISSHLKPKSVNKDITTDNWTFGFAYKNGYGHIFSDSSFLTFYHTGSLNWSHIDIELAAANEKEQIEFDKFDEEMKFGTSFESGIMYNLTDIINLNISYFHSLTFQNVALGKWLGSSFIELIFQRTLDFWSYEIIKYNNNYGPLLNFISKSACSVLIYELRRNKQFFPFNSNYALSYDGIKFGFVFTF